MENASHYIEIAISRLESELKQEEGKLEEAQREYGIRVIELLASNHQLDDHFTPDLAREEAQAMVDKIGELKEEIRALEYLQEELETDPRLGERVEALMKNIPDV